MPRVAVIRLFAMALLALLYVSAALAIDSLALDSSARDPSPPDRSVVFFPLASTADSAPSDATTLGRLPNVGVVSGVDEAWSNYLRLWTRHHQSPQDSSVRSFLGIIDTSANTVTPAIGRTTVKFPVWRAGSYQKVDTPHFQILSRADAAFTQKVAEEAEQFYWIWTQMFFPFWESSLSLQRTMTGLSSEMDIAQQVRELATLKSSRPRMRVVIFRDANEYQSTLVRDEPGVAQSTGYYSDKWKTTFVFGGIDQANEVDATATRHHEWTHQLFREATFSRLGNRSPGEAKDFWLVEGIAGYMESLAAFDQHATVGGWDSERLQYARYRILVGGDALLLSELRSEGRLAVQRRTDLSRWYAHAITQTHRLMDSEEPSSRQWLYGQLARLYEVNTSIAPAREPMEEQQQLRDFLVVDDEHLLANSRIQPPRKLCLAQCEVTSRGLESIPPSNRLSWLDLSRMKGFNMADVERLCADPKSLNSLSLEATAIEPDAISSLLLRATELAELDLSSTPADNSLATAIQAMNKLETLWLTGSRVGDEIMDGLISRTTLQTVDVQRTQVSEAGIERLRKARPQLRVNPLEVH